MAAPRLLVVAAPKMLPALAAGLREGGAFEVEGLPFSDLAALAQASAGAQALVLFYGTSDKSLPAVLEAVAAPLRKRAASVVAVLHKDTASQRDACFRAGASDVLFMPMPKDAFRQRLVASVGLAVSDEPLVPCTVSVAVPPAEPKPLAGALLSRSGVRGTGLPAATGDTVRLSVGVPDGPMELWGLVAPAQGETTIIRFAGLSQEEALRLRELLDPPPPTRPPPVLAPSGATATPAAGVPPVPASQPILSPSDVPQRTADEVLSSLFDVPDEGAPASASTPAVPTAPAAPAGPLWPGPIDLASCKTAVTQMLKDRELASSAQADLAAAARKVAGGLSSVEREALERAGADSHLHEALYARMALALANALAGHLFASEPPAVVDAHSLSALVLVGDTAAKRLQGEADQAITKGEVEALQMITAASSALSREQLTLKETADRLRGIAAAPRLGAGALDPDLQIAGQAAKAVPRKDAKAEVQQQARAELRDFVGLEDTPKAGRSRKALYIGLGVLAVSLLNVLWFSRPGLRSASQELLDRAGVGVVSISVASKGALVTVTKGWLLPERRVGALSALCDALQSAGVEKAALLVDGGGTAGVLDVKGGCNPWGLKGGKTGQPPAPPVPARGP